MRKSEIIEALNAIPGDPEIYSHDQENCCVDPIQGLKVISVRKKKLWFGEALVDYLPGRGSKKVYVLN